MILTICKSLSLYNKEVRDGNFKKNSNKIKTIELLNKTILIAGLSRIGKSLAKMCSGFNMIIKVYDPFVSKDTVNLHN